jgi:hypothetical protein
VKPLDGGVLSLVGNELASERTHGGTTTLPITISLDLAIARLRGKGEET